MEIVGYLIGAVGVAVGVWGLRRTLRQQRAAGLHTLIGDAGLQLLRMLVKFGPIHETKERRVGTALMTRAFFLGPFMVSSLAPENEWIRPTLYHLENEGLIEGSERGRWPQGPSEAWITE